MTMDYPELDELLLNILIGLQTALRYLLKLRMLLKPLQASLTESASLPGRFGVFGTHYYRLLRLKPMTASGSLQNLRPLT